MATPTPEAVVNTLVHTFSADAATRKLAEEQIAHLTSLRGAIFLLIQVAAAPVREDARQAAAITVKNLIKKRWGEDAVFGQEPDRMQARTAVLDALMRSDVTGVVRDTLAEAVNELATRDFPQRWPDLLLALLRVVHAKPDPVSVHNALLALRKVAKRYEYKSFDASNPTGNDATTRGPLEQLVQQAFPLLRGLLQTVLPSTGQHADAAALAKLILKIFWSCTQFALPRVALTDETMVLGWFEDVRIILESDAPAPAAEHPEEDDQVETQPAWKLKKWAAQIATRFLTRYGRPKFAEDGARPFARKFASDVAPLLLNSMLGLLAAAARGRWVSRRVRQLAFTYVCSAVEVASLYKLLRPNLEFMLFECALPTLCATPQDVRRFRDDPQEYVRRAHDPLEDFFEPRAAATALVGDLVRCKGKAVLEPLLQRLNLVLEAYQQHPSLESARQKDGALCALGAIANELQSRANVAPAIAAILATHVLPELEGQRSFGILRCRACWTLQRFAEHAGVADISVAPRVCAALLRSLDDADLPVRVEATALVRHLLASDVGGFDQLLRPHLGTLLESCFRVMREAASDDVVQALEIVVDRYGKDVAPYAVALAQRLAEAFHAYAGEEDDEEASMAAVQCVEAMAATLASLDDNENNVYAQLEPFLLPVLHRVFEASGDFLEYFENGVEVTSYLTYHGRAPFSPDLWAVFDRLITAFSAFAYDYIAELIPPLDNFVSRDTEQFLASNRLEALISVPERILWPDHMRRGSEEDCRKATHILLSILHNCRGSVDDYARTRCAPLVCVALERALGLPRADEIGTTPDGVVGLSPDAVWRPRLGASLLDVWNSLLIYDARLALAALDDGEKITPAQATLLLTKWLELAPECKGTLSRKLAALALSAVLALEPGPPRVAQARLTMLAALVDVVAKIKADERPEGAEEDDDDDELAVASAEDEWVEEDNEDDDDDDDDDREAVASGMGSAQLAGIRSRLAEFDAAEAWLNDDDDDDDDCYSYQSPIDDEDPYAHFVRALHACKRAGDFEAMCAQLGEQRLGTLQKVAMHAEQASARGALV